MDNDEDHECFAQVTNNAGSSLANDSNTAEDDLDDLDDMLEDFSTTNLADSSSGPQTSKVTSLQESKGSHVPEAEAEDFAQMLQDQMAALMGNTVESPRVERENGAMIAELGTTTHPGMPSETPPRTGNASTTDSHTAEPDESFQKTIRNTMERMQASGDQATASAGSDDADGILAQVLAEMQGGGLEDVKSEEGFDKMLMSMMEQLTNKEILYDPMKELNDKFPSWMATNTSQIESADLQRYQKQQRVVEQIVQRFERTGYSDSNVADREYIVERMQQMQAAGSPPADLIGNMSVTQEPLEDVESGCPQQ